MSVAWGDEQHDKAASIIISSSGMKLASLIEQLLANAATAVTA